MQETVRCPDCKCIDVVNTGPLPAFSSKSFGGVDVGLELDPGSLFHCPQCDLLFRHPYLSETACLELYENLPTGVWHAAEPRPYWRRARLMIEARRVNRTVLDCGCFEGEFLGWLQGDWEKLGIEPARRAAEEARKKGIRIVGATVDTVGVLPERPGTITLFDVLEHVAEPLNFLGKLKSLLAPGGSILVMTGATDTLPWQTFGRHYWYCSLPEHVSFFSLRWFRWAAEELDLKVERHHYLSSESRVIRRWAKQLLQISASTVVRRLREAGWSEQTLASIPGIRRVARWRGVPWWNQAMDHIMILLRA